MDNFLLSKKKSELRFICRIYKLDYDKDMLEDELIGNILGYLEDLEKEGTIVEKETIDELLLNKKTENLLLKSVKAHLTNKQFIDVDALLLEKFLQLGKKHLNFSEYKNAVNQIVENSDIRTKMILLSIKKNLKDNKISLDDLKNFVKLLT
jgi:hypothetical protein